MVAKEEDLDEENLDGEELTTTGKDLRRLLGRINDSDDEDEDLDLDDDMDDEIDPDAEDIDGIIGEFIIASPAPLVAPLVRLVRLHLVQPASRVSMRRARTNNPARPTSY
eukprot:9501852-Pyramimonas_sp.AAC.1